MRLSYLTALCLGVNYLIAAETSTSYMLLKEHLHYTYFYPIGFSVESRLEQSDNESSKQRRVLANLGRPLDGIYLPFCMYNLY